MFEPSEDPLKLDFAILELHRAFDALNKRFFNDELPAATITIQHQGTRTRNILGWFIQKKIWKSHDMSEERYEINITAEYLNRPANEILATLQHEMVHLYCTIHDIKGTSRNGYYHNKKFKEQAERAGLLVDFVKSRGWATTEASAPLISFFEKIELKPEAFILQRYTWGEPGEEKEAEKKKKERPIWACPECEEIKIRSIKKVNLICGTCMKRFEQLETDEEEAVSVTLVSGSANASSSLPRAASHS